MTTQEHKKTTLLAIHPGEILKEEFLDPMGISQYKLAKSIYVDQLRISEIVRGKRGITADTALRLAKFFGTTERFWLNLQNHYDLNIAKKNTKAKKALKEIVTFKALQATAR